MKYIYINEQRFCLNFYKALLHDITDFSFFLFDHSYMHTFKPFSNSFFLSFPQTCFFSCLFIWSDYWYHVLNEVYILF